MSFFDEDLFYNPVNSKFTRVYGKYIDSSDEVINNIIKEVTRGGFEVDLFPGFRILKSGEAFCIKVPNPTSSEDDDQIELLKVAFIGPEDHEVFLGKSLSKSFKDIVEHVHNPTLGFQHVAPNLSGNRDGDGTAFTTAFTLANFHLLAPAAPVVKLSDEHKSFIRKLNTMVGDFSAGVQESILSESYRTMLEERSYLHNPPCPGSDITSNCFMSSIQVNYSTPDMQLSGKAAEVHQDKHDDYASFSVSYNISKLKPGTSLGYFMFPTLGVLIPLHPGTIMMFQGVDYHRGMPIIVDEDDSLFVPETSETDIRVNIICYPSGPSLNRKALRSFRSYINNSSNNAPTPYDLIQHSLDQFGGYSNYVNWVARETFHRYWSTALTDVQQPFPSLNVDGSSWRKYVPIDLDDSRLPPDFELTPYPRWDIFNDQVRSEIQGRIDALSGLVKQHVSNSNFSKESDSTPNQDATGNTNTDVTTTPGKGKGKKSSNLKRKYGQDNTQFEVFNSELYINEKKIFDRLGFYSETRNSIDLSLQYQEHLPLIVWPKESEYKNFSKTLSMVTHTIHEMQLRAEYLLDKVQLIGAYMSLYLMHIETFWYKACQSLSQIRLESNISILYSYETSMLIHTIKRILLNEGVEMTTSGKDPQPSIVYRFNPRVVLNASLFPYVLNIEGDPKHHPTLKPSDVELSWLSSTKMTEKDVETYLPAVVDQVVWFQAIYPIYKYLHFLYAPTNLRSDTTIKGIITQPRPFKRLNQYNRIELLYTIILRCYEDDSEQVFNLLKVKPLLQFAFSCDAGQYISDKRLIELLDMFTPATIKELQRSSYVWSSHQVYQCDIMSLCYRSEDLIRQTLAVTDKESRSHKKGRGRGKNVILNIPSRSVMQSTRVYTEIELSQITNKVVTMSFAILRTCYYWISSKSGTELSNEGILTRYIEKFEKSHRTLDMFQAYRQHGFSFKHINSHLGPMPNLSSVEESLQWIRKYLLSRLFGFGKEIILTEILVANNVNDIIATYNQYRSSFKNSGVYGFIDFGDNLETLINDIWNKYADKFSSKLITALKENNGHPISFDTTTKIISGLEIPKVGDNGLLQWLMAVDLSKFQPQNFDPPTNKNLANKISQGYRGSGGSGPVNALKIAAESLGLPSLDIPLTTLEVMLEEIHGRIKSTMQEQTDGYEHMEDEFQCRRFDFGDLEHLLCKIARFQR